MTFKTTFEYHLWFYQLQVDVYLKPYKWQVWVAIATSIPVGALAAYFVENRSPDKKKNRSHRFYSFTNNMLYCYGAFLNERKSTMDLNSMEIVDILF